MDDVIALLGVTALALIGARAVGFLDRGRDLGISLFQPYRGDPWPVGVQEDDDVRFDWAPRGRMTPVLEMVLDAADEWERSSGGLAHGTPGSSGAVEIEDVAGDHVALERAHDIDVHRAGR
jgi:hypothetical protein